MNDPHDAVDHVREFLPVVLEGTDLTAEEMHAAVGSIMDGQTSPVLMSSFLTALRMKGEVVNELVGAATAMSQRAKKIPAKHKPLLDTCGTGGDGLCTFNISTATAIVTASLGVAVAKHGNRSVSSRSGSADVLESLGVNITLTPAQVAECIDTIGLGFCFAPLLHGAMKHAAPVRRELGIRTIFNLLGPLTNPAEAEYQLLGVSSNANAEKIAEALRLLGRNRAIVVCGDDRLDEVSLWGETLAFIVEGDTMREERWTADDFGLPDCSPDDLRVDSADESAEVIRSILKDPSGPSADIVLANTAAALLTVGHVGSLYEGVNHARDALTHGTALAFLNRLAEETERHAEGA